MAKKKDKNEKKLDYSAQVKLLKAEGPKRLYLLWGPEDYLREDYLRQLKALCLPEGEDSFSYKRMDGPGLDPDELRNAVDALPFMTERSFVELRDVELNKLKEPEKVAEVLSDIPEHCTVALVQGTQFEPDGRLKLIKTLRERAVELKFTPQSQGLLIKWIARRFEAAGKSVTLEAAQRLIFVSGDMMSGLIPEIEKVAAYAKGSQVTEADVDAVANHLPEAVVFDMSDQISRREYDAALRTLDELLADKSNEPIMILAVLGNQMRRLYAARLALERGLGAKYLVEACSLRYDFAASKLLSAARGFTLPQLRRAVELCAETDYQLKSSPQDDRELLKEAVLRIAVGETDG